MPSYQEKLDMFKAELTSSHGYKRKTIIDLAKTLIEEKKIPIESVSSQLQEDLKGYETELTARYIRKVIQEEFKQTIEDKINLKSDSGNSAAATTTADETKEVVEEKEELSRYERIQNHDKNYVSIFEDLDADRIAERRKELTQEKERVNGAANEALVKNDHEQTLGDKTTLFDPPNTAISGFSRLEGEKITKIDYNDPMNVAFIKCESGREYRAEFNFNGETNTLVFGFDIQ